MSMRTGVKYVTVDNEKLRSAIEESHYNISEVSKILGRESGTLSNSLRYGKRIGTDDLQKICILLSRNMNEFIADEKPKEKPQPTVTQPIMATAQQADRIIELLEVLVENSTREVTLKLTSKQATAFGNWRSRSEDQFDTIIDVLKHIQTGVGKLINLWRT